MKKIICFLLICVCLISNCFAEAAPDEYSLSDFEFYQEYLDAISIYRLKQEIVHEIAEDARRNGFDESSYVIEQAQIDWWIAQIEIDTIAQEMNITDWENRYQEYDVATYVWLYLTKILNYNDYVAAGIVGNMMVEVGGRTLELQHTLYSYGTRYFYGLCQWNKTNYPEVREQGLIFQCEYLAQNIEYELDTFGYAYKTDYKYEHFLNLESERDAALMFAKCYERCAVSGYWMRQDCAERALKYFTE